MFALDIVVVFWFVVIVDDVVVVDVDVFILFFIFIVYNGHARVNRKEDVKEHRERTINKTIIEKKSSEIFNPEEMPLAGGRK